MAGGTDAEGLENYVDDSLRGEDVTGTDSSGGSWIEKTGFGDMDGHGGEAAVVQWDVGVDDTPEGKDYG